MVLTCALLPIKLTSKCGTWLLVNDIDVTIVFGLFQFKFDANAVPFDIKYRKQKVVKNGPLVLLPSYFSPGPI